MSGRTSGAAASTFGAWTPQPATAMAGRRESSTANTEGLADALESYPFPSLIQRHALSAVPANSPQGSGPNQAVPVQRQPEDEEEVVQRACASCQEDEPTVQRSGGEDEAPIQAKCAACEREDEAAQRQASHHDTPGPRLWVGAPGDPYERQADSVASAVMETWEPYSAPAASEPGPVGSLGSSHGPVSAVQRDVAPDTPSPDEDHDPELDDEVECQASAAGPPRDMAGLSTRLAARRGRGAPLPSSTQSFMSDRFQSDFSAVRIHDGGEAAQLAGSMRAHAFTSGRDIYFAPGQYRPGTPAGDRLLAHELTHVVQQAGGSPGGGGVQRKACDTRESIYEDSESKTYTRDVPDLTGTFAHREIERKMEGANPGLITEAPIPGATRETVAFNALGFADMYLAEGNKVSKIRGICRTSKGQGQEDETLSPDLRATFGPAAKSPTNPALKTHSAGSFTYSPKKTATGISGTFPTWFKVADLKPLGALPLAGGVMQVDNYTRGFPAFASAVAADVRPGLGLIGTGGVASGLTIPPELDYVALHQAKRFGAENKKTKAQAPGAVFSPTGGVRLYVVEGGKGLEGLYVYLPVGTNISSPVEGRFYRQQNAKLKPLLAGLKKGNPSVKPALGTKLRAGETRPALPAISPLRAGGTSAAAQPKRTRTTSTKRKQEQDAWFRQYDGWRGPLKDALKSKPHKSLKKKVTQDEKLESKLKISLPSEESAFTSPDQLEDFKRVRFWASGFGRLFARVRFALGSTFDLLVEKFEVLRTKFKNIKKSAGKLGKLGGGFGFVAKFGRLVVKALGKGVAAFLDASFHIFAACVNSLISAVTNRLTDGASEAVKEQICALETAYESLKTEIETRIRDFDQLETLVKAWQEISYWTGIASALKGAIQLAVQAAACLSPPALGCLWGLVAQVGIEIALDLIADTRWFQEKVIQHPRIQEIVDQFAGETYRKWMWSAVTAAGLDTKLGEAAGGDALKACKPVSFDANKAMAEGTIGDAAFKRRRGQWERDNRTRLEADIGAAISGTGGGKLTGREAQELVTALKGSGLSPAEMKEKLDGLKAETAAPGTGETPPKRGPSTGTTEPPPKLDAHTILHAVGATPIAPGAGGPGSAAERRNLEDLVKIARSSRLEEYELQLRLSPGWYRAAKSAKPGTEPMQVLVVRVCDDVYAGFVNVRVYEKGGVDFMEFVKLSQMVDQDGRLADSITQSLFSGTKTRLYERDPKRTVLSREHMMLCIRAEGPASP